MAPTNITEVGSVERISVPNLLYLLPIVGIVVSETSLFFDNLTYALWFHLLTLAFCIAAPHYVDDQANLFQVLALVPLFRLINLGMPVFFDLTLLWYPFIYAPLIPAAYLVARSRDDISLRIDLRTTLLLLPVALVASLIMGAIEYRIIQPSALIPAWDLANVLLLAVVMTLFVGFVEEVLFRGVLQSALEQHIGTLPGLLVASGLFGLLHAGYQLPLEIVFAGCVGLVYGLIYDRTDSLGLITVMHGLLNVVLFGVAPTFPHLLP